MRSYLFSLAILPLILQVVKAVGCPTKTYTVQSTTCLYACKPTPIVTYTALSTSTVVRSLPCPEITTEPGPDKVKRVGSAVPICEPTTTTQVSTVVCTSCPGTTIAKTTTTTSVTTSTKYNPCPTTSSTKTTVPTPTPTITPIPLMSTIPPNCSYVCAWPVGTVDPLNPTVTATCTLRCGT